MKNFSIIGLTLAVALAFAGTPDAQAAVSRSCEFLPNAPDQHLVVRTDTLWGIAGKFLAHPWCWPEVWGMNREQIRNPHWIYPGQIVYLDRTAGRLRLGTPSAGQGQGDGKGESGGNFNRQILAQIRTEGLGQDAVRSIPAGEIEPFLSQPLVVDADELKHAPRIVSAAENHVFLGKDDKAYVRGDIKNGTSFQIFRPGLPLKDPGTNEIIGYEAFYLGTLRLDRAASGASDVHTFLVANAKQEIGVGDLLYAAPPRPILNYVPHPPEKTVEGRIMSIYGGVVYAGQNQIVSINRGKEDGLDIGTVLQLQHFGQTVSDRTVEKSWYNSMSKQEIKLPDEQYGTVFIFRVFKRVSYGLIMQVTDTVSVGDVVKSPDTK